MNLSGAFENAVRPTESKGRLEVAAERLAAHKKSSEAAFDQIPVASFVVRIGEATAALDAVAENVSFDTLIEQVGSLLSNRPGSGS